MKQTTVTAYKVSNSSGYAHLHVLSALVLDRHVKMPAILNPRTMEDLRLDILTCTSITHAACTGLRTEVLSLYGAKESLSFATCSA